MECLLAYFSMVTVPPHEMVGLERMLDYRGVGLQRFRCIVHTYMCIFTHITYVHTCQSCGSIHTGKTVRSNMTGLAKHPGTE